MEERGKYTTSPAYYRSYHTPVLRYCNFQKILQKVLFCGALDARVHNQFPRPKFLPGAARRGERNILLRRKTEPLKNVPKWRRRRSLAKNEDFLSKGSPEPPPKIKGSEKVFSFFLRNKNAKDYIEVFFYRHGGGRTSCFKYRKAVSYYEHGH